MQHYDIAIVGAGIIGCAIARQLSRYELSIAVVEAANDVACGTTKANGGLVHAGYDPAPGTMKARVNARGCELYGRWADELGFGFKRSGSLVLGFEDADRAHIERLLANGRENGVPDMEIVGKERIRELEPRANQAATCALWSPSTGFVDPFEVAIASAENAAANGVDFLRSARLLAISREADGRFILQTAAEDLSARLLVNAAGNGSAEVSRMAGGEEFDLVWRQGNIVVLDHEERPLMPLYPIPTPVSKGVIVTGTVHGNTVITATAAVREPGDVDTYESDLSELLEGARRLVPDLDTRRIVRAFAGGRAVIAGANDFYIAPSKRAPGLFHAAGIQSPGDGERARHRRAHGADAARIGRDPGRTARLEPPAQEPGRFRHGASRPEAGAHRSGPGMGPHRMPLRDGAGRRDRRGDTAPPRRRIGRGGEAALPCRHGALPRRFLPKPRGAHPRPGTRVRPRRRPARGCRLEHHLRTAQGGWGMSTMIGDSTGRPAGGPRTVRDAGALEATRADDGATGGGAQPVAYDVVVIGGGPAGMGAALSARQAGASVAIIERDGHLGGILRQCIHPGFGLEHFKEELTGPEYAQRLIDEVAAAPIDVFTETMVIGIDEGNTETAASGRHLVSCMAPEGLLELDAAAVVLAMGCRERTRSEIKIPGSRPAGVFTAGLAQHYINIENLKPGKRFVILGSGDIGLIMARRLALEGFEVEGVYELMPYANGLYRNVKNCLEDFDIPLHLSTTVTRIIGNARLEAVEVSHVDERLAPVPGTERIVPCDALLLSVGLVPENELATKAGVALDPRTRGASVDETLMTSVAGIFSCGNVLHVHDLADNATAEARRAGSNAAAWAADAAAREEDARAPRRHGEADALSVEADGLAGYALPHRIVSRDALVKLWFRVRAPIARGRVRIASGSETLFLGKARAYKPSIMESVPVTPAMLKRANGSVTISIEPVEENER